MASTAGGASNAAKTMVETAAADDRRKRQVLLQKKKAKRNAEEGSATPPQSSPSSTSNNSPSPNISQRASQVVSRRRKQSMRNKMTSPSTVESPVQNDGGVESLNNGETKELSSQDLSLTQDNRVTEQLVPPKPENALVNQKLMTEQSEIIIDSTNVEENTAVSPKEDRNDRVEVEKKSSAWDTRSIHEFPPEPVIDPSWDASKTALFDAQLNEPKEKVERPDVAQEANLFVDDTGAMESSFQETNDEFNTFEAGSWAAATAPGISNVDCSLDVGMGTADIELATVAVQSMSVAASENDEKPFVDGSSDVLADDAPLMNENDDTELVVDAKVNNQDAMLTASLEDQPATNLDDGDHDSARVNANDETDAHRTTDHEVDFSATDLNNPLNILKDDEALLGSDHIRSDVADGNESSALDAVRLLCRAEQQKRIDQYKAQSDDSSSDDDDDEVPEDDSDDDFGEDDEIRYISADSEEEEELARHASTPSVPLIVGDIENKGATFGAAMAAADTVNDRFQMQLENSGIVTTNSSSSGSLKADSSAVGSSVASSALAGAGLVSLTGTSVSGSSVSAAAAAAVAPPPPPPAEPPKKKKKSKGSKKKQTPLFKIPPPSPEKLRKWEEDKMRPFKHLQAAAEAKEKAPAECSDEPGQIEEAQSSEYVSLSILTNVSSTHSQDEIETTLTNVSDSRTSSFVDGNEKEPTSQQVCESDQVEHSAGPNVPQMTQQAQDMLIPEARSVERDDIVSITTSVTLPSPPRVDRTNLDQAVGLAPGKDGIWKEENVKKTSKAKGSSPTGISDRNMAERLAVASSTAAMKFEERFGEIDSEVRIPRSASADSKNSKRNMKSSTAKGPKTEDKAADMSYFCSPEILGGTSFCQPSEDTFETEDGNLLSHLSSQAKTWVSADGSDKSAADAKRRSLLDSSFDDTHHAGMELVGGAFSTWKNSDFSRGAKSAGSSKDALDEADKAAAKDMRREERELLAWIEDDILLVSTKVDEKTSDDHLIREKLLSLLQDDSNFNSLCSYASVNVIMAVPSDEQLSGPEDDGMPTQHPEVGQSRASVHPFLIPTDISKRPSSTVLAANFISFLNRISLLSGIESPFKDENPFLLDVVNTSIRSDSSKNGENERSRTVQDLIFEHELGEVAGLVRFFYQACNRPVSTRTYDKSTKATPHAKSVAPAEDDIVPGPPIEEVMNLLYTIPTQSPCPFETAAWNLPSVIAIVLGFLGDPVVVCRMKMVNHFCHRLIQENEHVIMRDAVRLGGIGMHIRPAFWMWITLEKCGRNSNAVGVSQRENLPAQGTTNSHAQQDQGAAPEDEPKCITVVLPELEKQGREGKWHHVIQRDVTRAFGNMPPHKTGARLRTDSIVRALVTWGRGRVLSRGVKGGGVSSPTPIIPEPGNEKTKSKPRPATGPPPWERGDDPEGEDANRAPETVSQWSGISPVPSFCSGVSGESGSAAARANLVNGVAKAFERDPSNLTSTKNSRAIEELALSGNTLTTEMKEGLQNQLGYILHALAAAHDDVGYCQGMDYVVAHLLRVLQDTVRWHSVRGTLSPVIKSQPKIPVADSDEQSLTKEIDQAIESSLVVEETVFRVMDTFLSSYSLRHMYFPELRCLKTCCRVFERIIQMKLPVLADHFAYHELNVGLFALGWFQTLFLYLPSMPSATVCHMWDIWLVERSFKIFFRVGTAILFLSQPILLNHELEGMMTYLNTFPDATLLNPDILIACALQIKVTNRMLAEIERDLTGGY